MTQFLHIMPQGSKIYDYSIIKMINESSKFDPSQHRFIVSSQELYKLVIKYTNVTYVSKTNSSFLTYKDYISKSKNVLLHSNILSLEDLLKLKKSEKRKMIWLVWGHDLYSKANALKIKTNILKKIKTLIYYFFYDYLMREIKGIGIGFEYDRYEVEKRFGKGMVVVRMPYFAIDLKMNYFQQNKFFKIEKEKPLKVMIGHSSYSFLNHIEMIDLLSKYKEFNIVISLNLAYGEDNYREKVIKYATETFRNKIEINTEILSLEKYINYLKTVDIAIFAHTHQSALSNIFYLLLLDKILFLNIGGVVAKGLKELNIDYYDISLLNSISFSQLKLLKSAQKGIEFAKNHIDPSIIEDYWRDSINRLK